MAKTTSIDTPKQGQEGYQDSAIALAEDPEEVLEGDKDDLDADSPPDLELETGEQTEAPKPKPKRTSKRRPSTIISSTGGRPRLDGALPGVTAPNQPRNVPQPRFTTYKSDSVLIPQRPKAAFSWWQGLPTWAKDKVLCYVYRDWPFLIPIPDPPPGTRKTEFAYIDKIPGNEPLDDELDLVNRYGCGRYRLIINEEDQRPGDSRTLTTVFVTGLSNDLKSFPPADRRISDILQVDLTHPDNRSYVEFLRMRGLLPEQRNVNEENEKMATVTAVSEMTGLVRDLVNDRNQRGSEGDMANGKAMDLVAEGAKKAMDMTAKAAEDYAAKMRQGDEEREKRRAEAVEVTRVPVVDPFDQAIRIVTLLKDSRGNEEILTRFMDLSNKQMERMETILKDSLARPQLQPTPIVDRIKDLKDLREISRDLFGDKEDSVTDGVVDAAGDLAPKWMRPFIPLLVPIAQGIAQGFAARGQGQAPPPVQYPQQPQGQGQPQPPVQYPPQALPYPPAPIQFPVQPMPIHPSQLQPNIPSPAPTPIPTTVPGMDPQVSALLGMIRVPFLTQIQNPTLTGTDFAGWFQDGFGIPTHDQVIAYGPEALFQSICQYPPIANDLLAMRMPEKRVREFVMEFCAPKWEEDGKGEGDNKPEPGSVA